MKLYPSLEENGLLCNLCSLLYNGYRVSFPGVKRPERGANRPPPSSAEVEERIELYLYSPSGPSRAKFIFYHVLLRNFWETDYEGAFWFVTFCRLTKSFRHFEGSLCFQFKGQAVHRQPQGNSILLWFQYNQKYKYIQSSHNLFLK